MKPTPLANITALISATVLVKIVVENKGQQISNSSHAAYRRIIPNTLVCRQRFHSPHPCNHGSVHEIPQSASRDHRFSSLHGRSHCSTSHAFAAACCIHLLPFTSDALYNQCPNSGDSITCHFTPSSLIRADSEIQPVYSHSAWNGLDLPIKILNLSGIRSNKTWW